MLQLRIHAILCLCLTAAMIHPSVGCARRASDGGLVINVGGTYSGQWSSNDASVPVILVATADPVIIENSTLTGPGNLIATSVDHAKILVRNTHGVGLNSNVSGKSPGRFLTAESFDSIVIENNDLEQTSGIYLLTYAGAPKAKTTVQVIANRAHNIDGRQSDGAGGFLANTDAVQFVQFDQVQHVPNMEIAWNQVTNDPGSSAVEDVISIYKSSGTKDSPIRIHDNFINGAYAANPLSADYSGGGIMLGDGLADTPLTGSEFVVAFNNQVMNTTNYGMAISAGTHCTMHNNRIVSTGALPDGTPLPAQNVGAYVWNSNARKSRVPKSFAGNGGFGNRVGWMVAGQRHDWWVPDAANWRDNTHWPGVINNQTIADELAYWEKKVAKEKITVGASQ